MLFFHFGFFSFPIFFLLSCSFFPLALRKSGTFPPSKETRYGPVFFLVKVLSHFLIEEEWKVQWSVTSWVEFLPHLFVCPLPMHPCLAFFFFFLLPYFLFGPFEDHAYTNGSLFPGLPLEGKSGAVLRVSFFFFFFFFILFYGAKT